MVIRTMNSYAKDTNEKEEVVDEEPDDVPDLVDALDVDSDDEDDDDDDDTESRPRQSVAVAVGAKPKEGLTLATKVQESSWKEEAREKAINGEIAQLFDELKAVKPVMQVPKGAEVLRSHMFVVDKLRLMDISISLRLELWQMEALRILLLIQPSLPLLWRYTLYSQC